MKIGRREFLIGAAAAGRWRKAQPRRTNRSTASAASCGCLSAMWKISPGSTTARCGPRISPCWRSIASIASSLPLGIGYDFLREVTDAYFLFAYPFLLNVPGYNVRAVGLPDAERDRNLETLQYISRASGCARHPLSIGFMDARL